MRRSDRPIKWAELSLECVEGKSVRGWILLIIMEELSSLLDYLILLLLNPKYIHVVVLLIYRTCTYTLYIVHIAQYMYMYFTFFVIFVILRSSSKWNI